MRESGVGGDEEEEGMRMKRGRGIMREKEVECKTDYTIWIRILVLAFNSIFNQYIYFSL